MFEVTDKLLAIILSFLIFVQAYLIRLAVGTYIFPACLMSLAWFFFTFIPLTILFTVPINPISILYIFVCVSAFSLGALFFDWPKAFKTNKLKTYNDYAQFSSRLMRNCFYISCLLAIIFSTISLLLQGIDLNSLLFNLLETSGSYAAQRGQEKTEYTLLGVLATFFTYATAISGGLIYQQQKSRIKKWTFYFITFAPAVYTMITQSSKIIVYYSIAGYFAAFLLKRIYSNKLELFNWAILRSVMILILLMMPLLSVSFLSRRGQYELPLVDMLNILFELFKDYTLGQLYAFSDFFSYYLGINYQLVTYVNDFNSHGYYTFKSIFDMLGGDKYFPPGYFVDFFYHEGLSTNIYTIYRSLINDFGGVGTIFFMFISGLVVHAIFYRLLTHRRDWLACSAFIVVVLFIAGTYLMSIFVARWAILLLVAFTFILWINNKYWNQKCKRIL